MTTPLRTEDRLMALGETLRPLMATMADWGTSTRAAIAEASEPAKPFDA